MRSTILITGASKGIGRAIAHRMSEEGHVVIGIARTKPEGDFPGEFFAADLSQRNETQDVLSEITKHHRIDCLVNNAGRTTSSSVLDTTPAELEQIVQINLLAPLLCAQACIPHMVEQGKGRIVNIASRAVLGMQNRSAYAATKNGLIGFTKTWALELGPKGITVNTVAPGPILTDLYINNNPKDFADMHTLEKRIPLRHIGRPEDVAGAVRFFLSDDAGFVTGQTLFVCGGLSLGGSQ